MCFSAQIWTAYHRYVKEWGADLGIREFVKLYAFRQDTADIKIPKGVDAAFMEPKTEEECQIKAMIARYTAAQETSTQTELFKQRKRLADAVRTLETKTTKKAQEDLRIAGNKIEDAKDKLVDLRRVELIERDSRIFPGWFAPVLISEGGRLVVKPMRFRCRPAGMPEFYDKKFPGLYNARRDNLEKFWKGQFAHTHGVIVASRFYENVDRDGQNAVLEFRPEPAHEMLIACVWSHWTPPAGSDEPELLSFAAITDEPPPEVAAAGHDRCIVPIKPENVESWLNPGRDTAAMQRILDDRDRPHYEHRLAA